MIQCLKSTPSRPKIFSENYGEVWKRDQELLTESGAITKFYVNRKPTSAESLNFDISAGLSAWSFPVSVVWKRFWNGVSNNLAGKSAKVVIFTTLIKTQWCFGITHCQSIPWRTLNFQAMRERHIELLPTNCCWLPKTSIMKRKLPTIYAKPLLKLLSQSLASMSTSSIATESLMKKGTRILFAKALCAYRSYPKSSWTRDGLRK